MKQDASFVDIDYGQATRRLFWLTCGIGLTGSLVAWWVAGNSAGGGFLIGSAASLANLWIWHAIARHLSSGEEKPSRTMAGLFAGRFLGLFALGYVILKTLNVQPLAMVLGLFVSALAVIAEILFELVAR
ncbi:MAG: ATP synthase subunit I [Bryobacteraceae bacterium]